MSLLMAAQVEGEGEQVELRGLQNQLETTQTLVALLSQQLSELKEQVFKIIKKKKCIYTLAYERPCPVCEHGIMVIIYRIFFKLFVMADGNPKCCLSRSNDNGNGAICRNLHCSDHVYCRNEQARCRSIFCHVLSLDKM